ncbi:unnamed protein product [Spirodela intermedia]|uniref:Dof zinc finger protein n=1 Tax=Spirodela intermedia TaxID=51605 RepID=A0A7I8IFE7_SPIIN|nr:unnamed protein product [Spirodela intermedia]CAA6656341.1 unnamed protein product [Spirodela intermedia]
MDTAQWPRPQLMERRPRPPREHALNCPRCQSTNTKFCYYNNYSLSQPRYFCKTCRRYWTEGGSLRNRSSNSSSSATITPPSSTGSTLASTSATSAKRALDHPHPSPPPPLPIASSTQTSRFHQGQDLNLTFQQTHRTGDFCSTVSPNPLTCSSAASSGAQSAMDLLRGGVSCKGMSPFLPLMMAPDGGAVYSAGFGLQDFRSSSINFPLDGIAGDGVYGNVQDGSGRVFFPFEDLRRHVSSGDADVDQSRGQGGDPSVFWNGVIGGGGGASW